MAAKKKKQGQLKQYIHDEQKRANNPPVGLVTAETDHLNGKKTYQFDPHLDPQLQWAGKTEGLIFDVDTVSLHVHERIDPLTIIEAVRKKAPTEQKSLFHYFETKENNPPIREAIQFYKHKQGWSNRLIAGDSLLVMNSLIEKESMAGKVQMIYIDPPYGIRYGSNFQPFVNKRDVRDGRDEDLTQEPEMIRAFRDTWEFGIHSYLTYLRNRILLARDLLSPTGSLFVQIGEENLHHVRELLDEIMLPENFCRLIAYITTSFQADKVLANSTNYILWYARDKKQVKTNPLFKSKNLGDDVSEEYKFMKMPDGSVRSLSSEQLAGIAPLPPGARAFRYGPLTSQGYNETGSKPFNFNGKEYSPGANQHWKVSVQGLETLAKKEMLVARSNSLSYYMFLSNYPVLPITNVWTDTKWGFDAAEKMYVVQTNTKVIQRCLLMSTDPGDIVFDPTCGSGTTAFVAEQWGRRWVTCDTSRVSITLTKQRLMTTVFKYYQLAHPKEGISSGFNYVKVPHIKLSAIAYEETPEQEILYDQPVVDMSKIRVTGPFTVETVPSQRVRSLEEVEVAIKESDMSVSRSGETFRQNDWISEMLSTGIRGKNGQVLKFSRIEPIGGTRWIHAEGETIDGKTAAFSFGPEYAPLEQRQIELSIEEAQLLVPKPKLIVFASFHFDPKQQKTLMS